MLTRRGETRAVSVGCCAYQNPWRGVPVRASQQQRKRRPDLRLLGNLHGAIDRDAKISHCRLKFGMVKQQLRCAQVLGAPADQRRLRGPHIVQSSCAVTFSSERASTLGVRSRRSGEGRKGRRALDRARGCIRHARRSRLLGQLRRAVTGTGPRQSSSSSSGFQPFLRASSIARV